MTAMRHDVFGEIEYNADEQAWTGVCTLPVFAGYGKLPPDDHRIGEAAPEFARGQFALTIQDDEGIGPFPQQVDAVRFLLEHEAEVCDAVMTELVEACGQSGGMLRWLNARRESRLWGWLARLVGPEYKTADDLKQAVRCNRVEVSREYVEAYAYIAFHFDTIFGIESEHGLSVVYQPEIGASWGDGSAIYEL